MDNIKDVYHFLTRISLQYSTQTAFTYLKNKTLCDVTYSEFFYCVKRVAEHLSGKIESEKRVAIIAENSYEWLVYYWSIMLLGKSAALIDPEMPHEEITKRLGLLDIHFACIGEGNQEFGDAQFISMDIPGASAAACSNDHERETQNMETTEATVLFSSGTTGDFKAVRLSQKNIVSAYIPNAIEHGRTVFLPLPFYHSLTINCLITAMTCGCRIYIGSGIKYVLKDLQVFEPEMICVTPVYMNMFFQRLERHSEDPDILRKVFGKNLRYILTGGASPQQKVLDALRTRGIRILSSYGSSETFCIASGEIGEIEKCAGRVAPHMMIQFDNGEITVKGPTVFMGYFEGEEMSDAWYHTGDLGYLEDSNRLFLTGRKKNLIILSNGKNVSPEHLEAELCTIADVSEAVVYGENDKICAELYIGDNPGEDAQQRVRARIKELNMSKPTYYQIQKILFRDEPFQHIGVGKIRRNSNS